MYLASKCAATLIVAAAFTWTTSSFATNDAPPPLPRNIVGNWLAVVEFPPPPPNAPPGPPPFRELLTFHLGGTVSESSTTLHENSANPAVPQFNFNGSEGHGTWRRGDNAIHVTIYKLVFFGPQNPPAPLLANAQAGYFRIRMTLRADGAGRLVGAAAEGAADLLIGEDPSAPRSIVPFGGARVSAVRLN